MGWDRWFQIWLGEELCKWAEEQAKAALGTAEECAEQGLAPHWLSQQRQRPPHGHEVKPFPENHKRFKVGDKKFRRITLSSTRWCARCRAVAVHRGGFMGWYYDDGREKDQWVRKMPDGSNVPRSRWGCSICKIFLCRGCFRMEDAEGRPLPDAWDHRATSRGLLARTVACE